MNKKDFAVKMAESFKKEFFEFEGFGEANDLIYDMGGEIWLTGDDYDRQLVAEEICRLMLEASSDIAGHFVDEVKRDVWGDREFRATRGESGFHGTVGEIASRI